MSYKKTVLDVITAALAPVMRKLHDVSMILIGTKTNIIRLSTSVENPFGDTTDSYVADVIDNVYIQYPFNQADLMLSQDEATTDINSLSITELLPVIMMIPYSGVVTSDIDRNDIIVDCLITAKGKRIPIIFTGPKVVGSFLGKYEILKKYELTLQRGNLDTEIKTVVDRYIASLGVPALSSSVPVTGAIGVNISGTVILTFNNEMDTLAVNSLLTVTPEFSRINSWDVSGIVMTITPTTTMANSTLYTIGIPADIPISRDGISCNVPVSLNFTTV